MAEPLSHEEQVEQLVAAGLTRAQAERELAADRGENLSDIVGSPSQDARPA